MGKIILDGMEFQAPIGLREREKQFGNRIIVKVIIEGNGIDSVNDELSDTIDYGVIYSIVSESIMQPTNLLEYAARKVINNIKQKFEDKLDSIQVEIKKIHPPLDGIIDSSIIELNWQQGKP